MLNRLSQELRYGRCLPRQGECIFSTDYLNLRYNGKNRFKTYSFYSNIVCMIVKKVIFC